MFARRRICYKKQSTSHGDPPVGGTERILAISLLTKSGKANILSIYAPTLCSSQETKDQFYGELDDKLKSIPKSEHIFLLGDFNARVGSEYSIWPDCLGHFGVGKMNENGQRVLELCSYHKLCVTNTFFKTKPLHNVSWRHPRSGHWHQLDMIITRKSALNNILITRSLHSADCDTDHSLVTCKVRIKPIVIHHTKQKGRPRIKIPEVPNPELQIQLNEQLEKVLTENTCTSKSLEERWQFIRDTIYNSALQTFGKQTKKSEDWFESNLPVIQPVIKTKRTALIHYKKDPSPKNLLILKSARKDAQRTARQCANKYWQDLCTNIQTCADCGNIRGVYEGIKKAFGPQISKVAPLKALDGSIIKDRETQMARWAEHYQSLYATENTVTATALENIPILGIMEDLDTVPTEIELSEAIDKLAYRKAPGVDGIPAEALQYGKPALLKDLHGLLCQCWEEGKVPQELRDANIITLYKNKGDRTDCNNYRGISLLSIVGKAFARLILKRLQLLAERIYPESQCGFRTERSTVDMIFSLRQLQEKSREQRQPLYIAFIDLTKAFDLVSRSGLFAILERIGCPPKLLKLIISFHDNMQGTVQYDGSTSGSFPIKSGVKQGCVLAPTLFGIFFSVVLSSAFGTSEEGVYIRTRSDGKLFNLARLRAKTKVRNVLIRELLFADDAALLSHTQSGLQNLVSSLAHACQEFGLTISLNKTEVMAQDVTSVPTINIGNHTLQVVKEFTYLGSTITSNLSLDNELNKRIGKASGAMAKLSKRVWENNKLSQATKILVYRACILSTLLYGSESWTTYKSHEHRLNTFHLRCLRRILGITWQKRKTNQEVLEQANIPSMYALLSQRRLRWLGHTCRMKDGRIPKDILYGEMATGSRAIGRPLLRYSDVCRRDLRETAIDQDLWEEVAADRGAWRQAVYDGLATLEEKRAEAETTRRQKRRNKALSIKLPSSSICDRCQRDCHSRIGLHSHSKRCPSVDS